MREEWSRSSRDLDLSEADVTALIQPAFPGRKVDRFQRAIGGLANTNFEVWIDGENTPVMLRLLVRDGTSVAREEALNRLSLGGVPMPRFIYASPDNPVTGHAYILMEWVDGVRLELAASAMKPADLIKIGCELGMALAAIHGVKYAQTGFFDDLLEVATPVLMGSEGLLGYMEHCLIEKKGSRHIGAALTKSLFAFVREHGRLIDSWKDAPSLAHGDFGGSNILVRESADTWAVSAILDWEFAFSGTPFFDFGNLLRAPLGDLPGFAEAVRVGYLEAGGSLPDDWQLRSRISDLFSWCDFLSKPNLNAALIRDARANIERTIGLSIPIS